MNAKRLDTHESFNLELRRGVLVIAVLSQLGTEQYGYSLKRLLNSQGLKIDEGTLYPLLRRLEAQALLESSWRIEEGRPRRYYKLSHSGQLTLADLTKEWVALKSVMERLVK
jgi:DNA-binding PadR family transcriptional regulator